MEHKDSVFDMEPEVTESGLALELKFGKKTEEAERIELTGAEYYCTHDPNERIYVAQGSVYVFIVPWETRDASGKPLPEGQPGRSLFLCEMPAQRFLPAFACTDMHHRRLRFKIRPKDASTVLLIEKGSATETLRRNFLRRADMKTYSLEGFDGSLADFYVLLETTEDSGRWKFEKELDAKIQKGRGDGFTPDPIPEGSPSYRVSAYACRCLKLPLMPEAEIRLRCGKKYEVADIARVSGFICRKVVLDADWHRKDCGVFVSTIGKELVACAPGKSGRYQVFYGESGATVPLTPELAQTISPNAFSLGRTLPSHSLTKKDVLHFCRLGIVWRDWVPAATLSLVCALISVLLPTINGKIYDDYIPLGDAGSLSQICIVLLSCMIGNICFSVVKSLLNFRVTARIGNDLQNAAYHRLFHLPESFFRNYDSADMATRISQVGPTATSIANAALISSVSALFSIVYFIRMFKYSAKLSWVGLGMLAVYILITVCVTLLSQKGFVRIAEASAKANSRLYQYLTGVDKIRIAGVEQYAATKYMEPYARQQHEEIRLNRIVSVSETLSGVVTFLFSMVLYYMIVRGKVKLSVGSFVAFNTAFGAFTSSLKGFADELLKLLQEKETIHRFWPVFTATPEDDSSKEVPGALTGALSLEHVSFAYSKGGKQILDDLSLQIEAGDYIGIVGPSGCGKSTLLKLLLGFETPDSGIITVDGKDLNSLDKGAYRRKLGVVLQNGKLISGSIYENITITAPNTSMARVNEVIDQVGLRTDIQQMPMGIHTVLSENSGTISGGQQQRILIARAIVGSPKILIFDEATSALDNQTQATVSENLDKMDVTRIVVAHRLSTIKNCKRILVLKDGKIAESGDYDSLMEKMGLFYELAIRQIAQ